MIIREWTLEDAKGARLAKFMKQFEQASAQVKVDVEYTFKKYYSMMEKGMAHILIAEEEGEILGAIGFIVGPDLHEEKKVAVETFWFVAPEHRGIGAHLFYAFEKRATELGCKRKAMVHMVDSYPESLKAFYEKNGYHLAECHYIKDDE